MVDAPVVHSRIERIRKCVSRVAKIATSHSKTEFERDPDAVDIAEHNIQTAIQCVLDISNHILADRKAGVPEDHWKVFGMLASAGIVSHDFADRLVRMAGLRNVLVHDYLDVNLDILYRAMTDDLGDFEDFIEAVTRLL